jgi:hypothetical protein
MLKKIFLYNNLINTTAFKKTLNFSKLANFSRKITDKDRRLEKVDEKNTDNNLTQNKTKSLKSKNNLKNYIDIDAIKDLPDLKVNSNIKPASTKDIIKNEFEESLKDKNINIIKEEVKVKIQPYFPNAVSEKEKSYTHIDTGKIDSGKRSKKESSIKDSSSLEILKNKRVDKKKIAAARKASLFMQNIKRELPEELYFFIHFN